MRRGGSRTRALLLLLALGCNATMVSLPALATERELEEETAPSDVRQIESPIERVFPDLPEERPPLIPWVRQQLQKLPPFFADTKFDARFRTYYLRQDRTDESLSEAWAMGGSLYFRTGWLEEIFQAEVEGFTSQPIVAPDSKDGTFLLDEGQDGYSVFGIANGRLRYKDIHLVGGRLYLDLPYVNRQDNRMTPNTFESLVLEKPEGELKFSTGYTWTIKLRNSDEFESFTEALGRDQSRGLAHAGVVWDPSEDLHLGAIVDVVPDLFARFYTELGFRYDVGDGFKLPLDGLKLRLDGQFTVVRDIGDKLGGELIEDTWNLGIRASTSYEGAVFRLGGSFTGSNAGIFRLYGSSPSYVDLMQRNFTAAGEKALLASVSYDFANLGVKGLSAIVNFVAAFDGEFEDRSGPAQEIDLTFDYKIRSGLLKSFWLRLRGSWLAEDGARQDGTDFRVILRYNFPVM